MRYASVMQLKKGYEKEYQRRHDDLWPELKLHLTECGIHSYYIYLLEETGQLFATFEADQLNKRKLVHNPLMQRWWRYMADIMETKESSWEPLASPLKTVFTFGVKVEKKKIVLVLDIGKTNIKLCLIDLLSGECVRSYRTANQPNSEGRYPHSDTAAIWRWIRSTVREVCRDYSVRHICITTHGATIACLSGGELALPILDYEYTGIEEFNDCYHAVRPNFLETFSPRLPAGLNLGKQLFWLQKRYPKTFQNVDTLLTYPQYWVYRFTGVSVSEVTSLGCHTDLWNPVSNGFSTLTQKQGWDRIFPPLFPSGEAISTVKDDLARDLGLPESCLVHNGIHDSNASLVPYINLYEGPKTIISSGTWTIIATINGQLKYMDESKDMLANVDVKGQATPTIRFMGGREWAALKGNSPASISDVLHILESSIFALPSFSEQGGPFACYKGQLVNGKKLISESQKSALADLYLALISNYCLEKIQSADDIFVAGVLSSNPFYLEHLASLRPHSQLFKSTDRTGTALGAAMLSTSLPSPEITKERVPINNTLRPLLHKYQAEWRQQVRDHCCVGRD